MERSGRHRECHRRVEVRKPCGDYRANRKQHAATQHPCNARDGAYIAVQKHHDRHTRSRGKYVGSLYMCEQSMTRYSVMQRWPEISCIESRPNTAGGNCEWRAEAK